MRDLHWKHTKTCSVFTASLTWFEIMKDWEKIEKQSGGCHLLASSPVRRASGEYQNFGMFSLTS